MRLPAPWAVETGAAPQVVAETRKESTSGKRRQISEPRPGNPAGSLCTQPQMVWTPPLGRGEASLTLRDYELQKSAEGGDPRRGSQDSSLRSYSTSILILC